MAPPASKRQASTIRGRQRASPGKPAKRAVSARAAQLWPGRRKPPQARPGRRTEAQPWSARFEEPVSELVQRFTASVGFDRRLALHDIAGSRAHARMLAACAIISRTDCDDIERGLAAIREEIEQGRFTWSLEAEDVHLNIERRLTELVGEAGKRLQDRESGG